MSLSHKYNDRQASNKHLWGNSLSSNTSTLRFSRARICISSTQQHCAVNKLTTRSFIRIRFSCNPAFCVGFTYVTAPSVSCGTGIAPSLN